MLVPDHLNICTLKIHIKIDNSFAYSLLAQLNNNIDTI